MKQLDAARAEIRVAVGVVRLDGKQAAIDIHGAQGIAELLATGGQVEPSLHRLRVQLDGLLELVDREGVLCSTGELDASLIGLMELLRFLRGR